MDSAAGDMSPKVEAQVSLATTESLLQVGDASSPHTTSNDMTTTQEVIAGLSQLPSLMTDQIVPSVEQHESNTVKTVLVGLSTMSPERSKIPDVVRSLKHEDNEFIDTGVVDIPTVVEKSPVDETLRPISELPNAATPTEPHSSAFAAFHKRALEKAKRRRTGSASSASSGGVLKKPRLFGLDDEKQRWGSTHIPIVLPSEEENPDPKHLANVHTTAVKQYQSRKAKEMSLEPAYSGIHALLDTEGRPTPFPVKVQALIKTQQSSYKTIGISKSAYDGSFAQSMVEDGRGKLGERGFSSTGTCGRSITVVFGNKSQAEDRESILVSSEENLVMTLVGGSDDAAIIPTAAEDVPAKMQVASEMEVLTNEERLFGNYKLLEMILLRCGETGAHATVLKAQGVNKTFERVIRRSRKLQQMLH